MLITNVYATITITITITIGKTLFYIETNRIAFNSITNYIKLSSLIQ